MAYNQLLSERVRKRLSGFEQKVTEKKMFGGLAFLLDGKMCINISGDKLMCRFDPGSQHEVEKKKGYLPMVMKGKQLEGYCYVESTGFTSDPDFEYWMNLCLDFNREAKVSKRK